MWMSQLTGSAWPPVGIADSGSLCADRTALKAERVRFDQTIIDWADTIALSWLAAGERPADTDLPFMPE
jgi:hypothetical protein